MATKKKPKALEPASSFIIEEGSKDKTLHDWLEREEDKLLEWVLDEASQYNVFHVANTLKREPICVLRKILSGDIPEMAGFDCEEDSEEEAEFIGLALSGVPLQACLRWCIAGEDRPPLSEVTSLMTAGDMREHLNLIRRTGMWFGSLKQLEKVTPLLKHPEPSVTAAIAQLVDRFEAPTPEMVALAIAGKLKPEATPVIHAIVKHCKAPSRSQRNSRAARSSQAGTFNKKAKKAWSGSYKSKRRSKTSSWR